MRTAIENTRGKNVVEKSSNTEKPKRQRWTVTQKKIIPHEQLVWVVKQLRERAKSNRRYDVRRHFVFMLYLGSAVRNAEGCNLKIGDCAVSYNQDSLEVINGKGGKDRLVIIDPNLKKLIKSWIKFRQEDEGVDGFDYDEPLIVSDRKTKYTPDGMLKLFKKIYKDFCLPEQYFVHTLRHCAISNWYRESKDLITCGRQAGHAHPSTTAVYSHVEDDEVRAIVKNSSKQFYR